MRGQTSRRPWGLLLAALALAMSGCELRILANSARMRRVASPRPLAADASQATVVFVRPGRAAGFGYNAIFEWIGATATAPSTGRALGELPGRTKLVASFSPGEHTFIKYAFSHAGGGDFTLPPLYVEACNSARGTLEAGKIYFIEESVYRLFPVRPGDPRLQKWAALPDVEVDPAKDNLNVAADPVWPACVANAQKNAAEATLNADTKSVIRSSDGFARWP